MGNYTREYYHNNMPDWRTHFRKKGKYVGIEFELEARTSYQAVLRLLPNFTNRHRPITESDGSLSGDRGLEIVFPPFLASTLKKKTSVFGRALAAISPEVTINGGAGMHMNINTTGWSTTKINSLLALINNLPRKYLENIGQRRLNGYCSQIPGLHVTSYEDMADHCYAAEDKGGCIEMRFPRSTTDHSRVVNLLEFFDHAEAFVNKIGVEPTRLPRSPAPVTRSGCDVCGDPNCGESSYDDDDDDFTPVMDYTGVNATFDAFMLGNKRRRRIKEILDNGYPS